MSGAVKKNGMRELTMDIPTRRWQLGLWTCILGTLAWACSSSSSGPGASDATESDGGSQAEGGGSGAGDGQAGASAGAANCEPAAAQEFLDVSYASFEGFDPRFERLDIYVPERADDCERLSTVVWVHGGGWRGGDKTQGNIEDKVTLMNGLGYVFVSVNYRLSHHPELHDSDVGFPVHPQDVGLALGWIEDNIASYGGDADRIALLGHSAGAHLVALVSLDPVYLERADASRNLIDCVGSFDTEGYNVEQTMTTSAPALISLYENAFGGDSDVWKQASPILHVGDNPPVPDFLLASRGTADRQQLASDFAAALEEEGAAVTIIDAAAYDHAQVNQKIGAEGDEIMTPALREFLANCF